MPGLEPKGSALKVLAAVVAYHKRKNEMPTVAEIIKISGVRRPRVRDSLETLAIHGYLERRFTPRPYGKGSKCSYILPRRTRRLVAATP